jgi:hypothetical protein
MLHFKEWHARGNITEENDPREYDFEGDMAKGDLRSIIVNAKRVHDMLEDNTNLPEWVQSKITKAEDYISTVANYLSSESMKEEVEQEDLDEANYQGREVPLNKPMAGDVKKSKVFVKDPSTGNIKKVNFGDKTLSIKKHIPNRKKSYCARSSGQGNLTDKTKANYWSRRAWDC